MSRSKIDTQRPFPENDAHTFQKRLLIILSDAGIERGFPVPDGYYTTICSGRNYFFQNIHARIFTAPPFFCQIFIYIKYPDPAAAQMRYFYYQYFYSISLLSLICRISRTSPRTLHLTWGMDREEETSHRLPCIYRKRHALFLSIP